VPGRSAIARVSIVALIAAAACTEGGPDVAPIEDQVTAVGEELVIEIEASGSDRMRYQFSSNHPGLPARATISTRPDGNGVWSFQPDATDVGTFVVDFEVVDATGTTVESVEIDVRSAIGNATLPVFHRPLGSGTVLDSSKSCIDVPIQVSDQDSSEVVLALAEPIIEGGMLFQESEFVGAWRWCPTPAQRASRDRYLLTIGADDDDNPAAIKRYQIILRDRAKPACDGLPPTIEHSATDVVSVNDIAVVAAVADDTGLKGAPLLYYSMTPPPEPIDLTTMTQLTMTAMGTVERGGTFRAEVPNPLFGLPPGSQTMLYYVLVAEDNDDAAGDCDHVVIERFQMRVSTPGGDGQLGLCETCSSGSASRSRAAARTRPTIAGPMPPSRTTA
jgi:hypothetical protein